MGWEDAPLVTSEEPTPTNAWEAAPLVEKEKTNAWEAAPLVEEKAIQSNITYEDDALNVLNKRIEDNVNNYFKTSAITEEDAIKRFTAPPSLAIRPEIREQMMPQEQPTVEPEQQGIRSLNDQLTMAEVQMFNNISAATKNKNLEKNGNSKCVASSDNSKLHFFC